MAKRWLRQLLGAVSKCWEWHSLALRIGCRYRPPEGQGDGWEVWVYPAVQEVGGGPHDGEAGWCGFHCEGYQADCCENTR
jgi:hypothetical protein